jgi:subtilisin family serine protease
MRRDFEKVMNPLDLVKLRNVMELTSGRPEILVGLIDGPVAMDLPELTGENIRGLRAEPSGACTMANSLACTHGTFVAGILSAKRTSAAPAICPNCTLLVRPIFIESMLGHAHMPGANPGELAAAIIDTVNAGAHVINLSAALTHPSMKEERFLEEALNYAAFRQVILVAAAGNQGQVGSTTITRHPWVISVAACDQQGYPMRSSNLGHSIGKQGLSAPGYEIVSLGTNGNSLRLSGTSASAPFVTGAIALLYALFPHVTAAEIKSVLTRSNVTRRTSVLPPLLDAWAACQQLARARVGQSPAQVTN